MRLPRASFRAHAHPVRVYLRALRGCEHVHDLRVERFARLWVGRATFGVRLTELHDRSMDARALCGGEMHAAKDARSTVWMQGVIR